MSTKPETQTEERFIKLLDEYNSLTEEQEHIGVNDETLLRVFACYSTDDLIRIRERMFLIVRELLHILGKHSEIRQSWLQPITEASKTIVHFGGIIEELTRLRFH